MKISIVTAVYNNCNTLGDALDSVLSQVDVDVELVVIDGCSTDGTVEILHDYSDRLSVLVSEPDDGIYDALNKGISLSSGDLIGFMHSDDLFADKYVLARIAKIFSNPDIEAVYGDLVYVGESNTDNVVRYWRSTEFHSGLLYQGWMPPHPTFYARRSVYARLGGFDTSLRIAADYDCMVRFLKSGIHAVYIPETLVKMRVGGESNRSIRNIILKSTEDYQVMRRHQIGGIGTLIRKNLSKVPQFFRR